MCQYSKLLPNKGIFKYLSLDDFSLNSRLILPTSDDVFSLNTNNISFDYIDMFPEEWSHKTSKIYFKKLISLIESYYALRISDFSPAEQLYIFKHSYFLTRNGTLRLPAFIVTKCGHCDECVYDKCKSYINRATLEAYSCKSAFFFTLTYDDAHLPTNGLCRDDVVKFFKRFRVNLSRRSEFSGINMTFRSFYVGEYGKTTLRPHYHGILYFQEFVKPSKIYELRQIFIDSWLKGKIYDFQLCRNITNSSRYLTKYLFKPQPRVPDTFTKNFFQGPSKNGGLGYLLSPKVKQLVIDAFIKNGSLLTKIRLDNGKICNIVLPPTLVKRVLCIKDSRSFLNIKKDLLYLQLLYKRITKEFVDNKNIANEYQYYRPRFLSDITDSFKSCMCNYSFATCTMDFESNSFEQCRRLCSDRINYLHFFDITHEFDLLTQKLSSLLHQTKVDFFDTLYADTQHIIGYFLFSYMDVTHLFKSMMKILKLICQELKSLIF